MSRTNPTYIYAFLAFPRFYLFCYSNVVSVQRSRISTCRHQWRRVARCATRPSGGRRAHPRVGGGCSSSPSSCWLHSLFLVIASIGPPLCSSPSFPLHLTHSYLWVSRCLCGCALGPVLATGRLGVVYSVLLPLIPFERAAFFSRVHQVLVGTAHHCSALLRCASCVCL